MPCQNGGSCITVDNTYNCVCTAEYTGTRCEDQLRTSKLKHSDLTLLVVLIILLASIIVTVVVIYAFVSNIRVHRKEQNLFENRHPTIKDITYGGVLTWYPRYGPTSAVTVFGP